MRLDRTIRSEPRQVSAGTRDWSAPATFADQVYRRVRESIQNGSLNGRAALSEADLARQFGVSRTPVREALKRLVAEGLVETFPRRGTFVKIPDIDAIREIFAVREALEGMAACLAAAQHNAGELLTLRARLEDAYRAQDAEEVFAVGGEFHRWIIRSAGNRRLAEQLATLRSQTEGLFSVATRPEGQMDRCVREYRAVMDALSQRDGDGAAAAMRSRIVSVRDSLLKGP